MYVGRALQVGMPTAVLYTIDSPTEILFTISLIVNAPLYFIYLFMCYLYEWAKRCIAI